MVGKLEDHGHNSGIIKTRKRIVVGRRK